MLLLIYKPMEDFATRAADIERSLSTDERLRQIFRRTIDGVDRGKVSALQKKYKELLSSAPSRGSREKYGDLPYWIGDKALRAAYLNIDKRRHALDILDIGTGAAHFPAICKAYGHRVVGIDVDYRSYFFYHDVCQIFGIDRRSLGVYAQKPLANLGTRFDLITALSINFHFVDSRSRKYWSIDDWNFLINDLVQNHLKTPGTIHFELNQRIYQDGTLRYDQDVLASALEAGAVVSWPRGTITWSFPSLQLRP
jgi:SAM-dependent methyltransferase